MDVRAPVLAEEVCLEKVSKTVVAAAAPWANLGTRREDAKIVLGSLDILGHTVVGILDHALLAPTAGAHQHPLYWGTRT